MIGEPIYPGKIFMFDDIKSRCMSVLYTGSGRLRCIGQQPDDDEIHTHVGITESGLRVTWTDKDAEESRGINETTKPLVGWRVWELQKGGILVSVTSGTKWPGPILRAHAPPYARILGDRGPRDKGVDFGIYCYKNPDLLYDHMKTGIRTERWPVIGSIELTGRVVEHRKGYRAQVATFLKLWYIVYDKATLAFGDNLKKDMEDRYQCDVERIPDSQVKHWASYITSELEE